MPRQLCIHGHFYQPPREDPWLGTILPEGSAAPSHDWNTRILRESYAPLAWARRLDNRGRIADIMNCYEWMSFNVGPTLLRWMDDHAPLTLRRMMEGDRLSLARWGHGNAIAQAYHHIIMPLATPEDRQLEVEWAIMDFEARFRRRPEGMWLAESAVDMPTLESLADAGIAFTILAPRQAKAIASLDAPASGNVPWQPVQESGLDLGEPYAVELPSGRSIAVFFYNGPISQAVAFERLLQDGENFWRRLAGAATSGLISVCTDGETCGHHFPFGEMALAHVLGQGYAGRDGLRLTNFATYLQRNPPTHRVLLHEPSSWSCVHGVERWRSDCGCTDGGHPGWNQRWRAPLRSALDIMRRGVTTHFNDRGAALFNDAPAALRAYGTILAQHALRAVETDTPLNTPDCARASGSSGDAGGGSEASPTPSPTGMSAGSPAQPVTASEAVVLPYETASRQNARLRFAKDHLRAGLTLEETDAAWKLLAMQECSLASFASCAWFFDDITRIEPINALTYALRSAELAHATGAADLLPPFREALASAVSNKAEEGSGTDIFDRKVLPRQESSASLVLQALCNLEAADKLPQPGCEATWTWPSASITVRHSSREGIIPMTGTATTRLGSEPGGEHTEWQWVPLLTAQHECGITLRHADGRQERCTVAQLPHNRREALLAVMTAGISRRAEAMMGTCAKGIAPLVSPWSEAQRTMTGAPMWAPLLASLGLACIKGDIALPETRRVMQDFLKDNLATLARERLRELTEELFLAMLEKAAPDWNEMADRIRRTQSLLPDMDWWRVQNRLWQKGFSNDEGARGCAALLDFRTE